MGYRIQGYIVPRTIEHTDGKPYVIISTLGSSVKIIEIPCRIAVSKGIAVVPVRDNYLLLLIDTWYQVSCNLYLEMRCLKEIIPNIQGT